MRSVIEKKKNQKIHEELISAAMWKQTEGEGSRQAAPDGRRRRFSHPLCCGCDGKNGFLVKGLLWDSKELGSSTASPPGLQTLQVLLVVIFRV